MPILRSEKNSGKLKLFKNDKNAFCFTLKKPISFLKYLIFCPKFFGHVEIRLDKKAKIIFKIYDAIKLEVNDYNTHIAEYLNK